MYSSFEQRARQRGIDTIHEFETTHGRPGKSRTPISGYNPKKAMKQAEKAYLESIGTVSSTHLDVYKRQILLRNRHNRNVINIHFILFNQMEQ